MPVRVLTSLDEFSALEKPYEELVEASPSAAPFWSHSWIAAWWGAYRHRYAFRALCVEEDGALQAMVPLVFRGDHLARAPVRSARLAGADWALCDIPTRLPTEQWLHPLLSWLCGSQAPAWQVLRLGPLDPSSPHAGPLPRALDALGLHYRTETRPNPYLPIPGDWEAFLAGKSKNFRRTVRRKMRALKEAGGYELVQISRPGPDDLRSTVFRVSAASWQGTGNLAVAASSEGRAFYSELVRKARTFEPHLTALLHEGRCVAYLLGFVQKGVYHAFDTGFDPAHDCVSPGTVLHLYLLEHLSSQTVEEVNLGFPAPYKDRFDPLTRTAVELTIFRSALWLRWDAIARRAKRLLHG